MCSAQTNCSCTPSDDVFYKKNFAKFRPYFLLLLSGKNLTCSARKCLLFYPFLGLLANIDVFCRKISEDYDPFPHFQASWQIFMRSTKFLNISAPGNLSNLSFLNS